MRNGESQMVSVMVSSICVDMFELTCGTSPPNSGQYQTKSKTHLEIESWTYSHVLRDAKPVFEPPHLKTNPLSNWIPTYQPPPSIGPISGTPYLLLQLPDEYWSF